MLTHMEYLCNSVQGLLLALDFSGMLRYTMPINHFVVIELFHNIYFIASIWDPKFCLKCFRHIFRIGNIRYVSPRLLAWTLMMAPQNRLSAAMKARLYSWVSYSSFPYVTPIMFIAINHIIAFSCQYLYLGPSNTLGFVVEVEPTTKCLHEYFELLDNYGIVQYILVPKLCK